MIGQALQEAMAAANDGDGISPTGLAAKLEDHGQTVQVRTIIQYLRDEADPRLDKFAAICRALDIEPNDLLGFA